MKTFIFIHGPNGVGKSTACVRLHQRLTNSSWLEAEWCRMINPFGFTPEVELLTERNITALLRGYLECSQVEYVIFNGGFHGPRKRIYDKVLANLSDLSFLYLPITLTCSEEENARRIIQDGRDAAGYIQHSLQARVVYEGLPYPVIDTTELTVEHTIDEILSILSAGKYGTESLGRARVPTG